MNTCIEHHHDPTLTPAWAWVLRHSTMIRGLAFKAASGTGLDAEDVHGELIVRLVSRWHRYDSTQSAASTWTWWQARAVRKSLTTQRARRLREQPMEPDVCPLPLVQQPAAEATVMLRQLHDNATEPEWAAVVARAHGYEGEELRAECGCAPFSARRRVARLLDRTL